jgi:hypothetical protein
VLAHQRLGDRLALAEIQPRQVVAWAPNPVFHMRERATLVAPHTIVDVDERQQVGRGRCGAPDGVLQQVRAIEVDQVAEPLAAGHPEQRVERRDKLRLGAHQLAQHILGRAEYGQQEVAVRAVQKLLDDPLGQARRRRDTHDMSAQGDGCSVDMGQLLVREGGLDGVVLDALEDRVGVGAEFLVIRL